MAEQLEPWWVKEANKGIIGLGPESPNGEIVWPTEGYDGDLINWRPDQWDEDELARSGRTKEQWLALADEMIERWTAWRRRIAALDSDAGDA